MYATRRSWTVALQVKEIGSGASAWELREQIVEAAHRRDIDVVLVWRLDRWNWSVSDLPATLQELDHLVVGFVSLTEALDLTGLVMATLLAIFAVRKRHPAEQVRPDAIALPAFAREGAVIQLHFQILSPKRLSRNVRCSHVTR